MWPRILSFWFLPNSHSSFPITQQLPAGEGGAMILPQRQFMYLNCCSYCVTVQHYTLLNLYLVYAYMSSEVPMIGYCHWLTGMKMSTITPTLRSWPTLLNWLLAIGGYGSFAIRPHDLCAIGQTLVCSTSETSFLLLALNTSDAPCPDACGNQSYSRAIQNSMATSFHALSWS